MVGSNPNVITIVEDKDAFDCCPLFLIPLLIMFVFLSIMSSSCSSNFLIFGSSSRTFNCTSNIVDLVDLNSSVVHFYIKEGSIFNSKDSLKKHEVDVSYDKA